MIKDVFNRAIQNENIDSFPINIKGELEVIVKDIDGNVISYQKDHNTVTKGAKMQIMRMLAGEIVANSNNVYSVTSSSGSQYKLFSSLQGDEGKLVPAILQSSNYSSTYGQLVTGLGQNDDYSGVGIVQGKLGNDIGNKAWCYPTKMLFGTGLETTETGSSDILSNSYENNISEDYMESINFFEDNTAVDWGDAITNNENFYSNSPTLKARTLQPADVKALTDPPSEEDTAITGAIKNGITDSDVVHRGCGYPCFIYASRKDENFYTDDTTDGKTKISKTGENNKYFNRVTYTVKMPVKSTYPYNGWILKQAGLFCDARYLDIISSSPSDLENQSMSGILLFKKNIAPVVKQPDNEIIFNWTITLTL